jgi:hypothetical protein
MDLSIIILLIVIIIVLTYFIRYGSSFIESFGEADKNPPQEASSFINFNLTTKPVANYAPYPIYTWWKYHDEWNKYKTCNQYRCQSPCFNECNARAYYKASLMDQSKVDFDNSHKQCVYFNNASKYCFLNPHDERCPNNWIK